MPLENSPLINEALKSRGADDIWVVVCDACHRLTYYNQGSHCYCEHCDTDLMALIEDDQVQTLEEFWTELPEDEQ